MYNNEISYVAKPKTKLAKSILIGLIGSSVIFVIAANLTNKFSGIVWTVAFAFMVATIYVYTRYVGAEYCYSITSYNTPSLIVTQKVGNTVKTMARIDLDSITEVRLLTREDLKKYKHERGVVRYSYNPTMCPSEIYLVSMRSAYENADLFIETDGEFAAALRAASLEKPEGFDPY
jgi:hypothetical protein